MPELSKHELDKLFQQGAERYDFEYNPAAWDQMAAMLERSRRRRALIWWLAGLAAFLLLAGLAFCFFRPEANLVKKKEYREPAQIEPARGAEGGKEERGINAPLPRKANPESSPNAQELNAEPFETKAGEKPLAGLPPTQATGISRRAMETLPAIAGPVAPEQRQEPEIWNVLDFGRTKGEVGSANSEVGIGSGISAKRPFFDFRLPTSDLKEGFDGYSPERPKFKNAEDAGLPINHEKEPAQEAIGQLPQPAFHLPLLSIGKYGQDRLNIGFSEQKKDMPRRSSHLVAGPGFSAGLNSIGWGSFSRSAWKAGLFAEYRYNGRFGLGLGANYLRANYVAGRGEYIPPKGFWTRRIPPDNTRGVCNILEVPLMMKYYPKGYSAGGPFVSAGLSSYLMLMEEYWYRYSLDEPDLIRWWQTTKGQSHWFALGQISAGYQANPGNRWSLQLGPYLQVPISGVGHGQVKIYSLGADLRILWRIW